MRLRDSMAVLFNTKLRVSMARYNKGGSAVYNHNPVAEKKRVGNRRIINPAFRDNRKYSEVLLGVRKQNPMSKMEEECNIIPICFSLNVSENRKTAALLERAVIAENTEPLNLCRIELKVTAMAASMLGMYSLSPTKILIVFPCKETATNAVSTDSPLWKLFDDIRIWSEGELFDDRLVWIECVDIYPVCWSMENMRRIGQKWRPILHIDNSVGSLDSLTFGECY